MRVLIVDDDEIALELLSNTLSQAGHEVRVAKNGLQALEILRTGLYRLVISDWEMPEMNGIELCRRIRARQFAGYIYIILVTARDGTANVVQGLDAGADDFISKPFQPTELCVRVRAGERILALDSRDLIIFSLAKLAESRDPETGAHLERMREYCRVITQHLSTQAKYSDQVDGDYVQTIYLTSPLHDIGKVGIPDCVLLKPGRLTDREFNIMKKHTIIGGETLTAAAREHPGAEFLRTARDIALSHHERFDGSGYPFGLTGEEIPLAGRIVALADVYDALTTKRVYKTAFSHDVARSILLEGKGVHFDPDIIDGFVQHEGEFVAIQHRFTDGEWAAADEPAVAVDIPA
jgi:putative two-component system response regulator